MALNIHSLLTSLTLWSNTISSQASLFSLHKTVSRGNLFSQELCTSVHLLPVYTPAYLLLTPSSTPLHQNQDHWSALGDHLHHHLRFHAQSSPAHVCSARHNTKTTCLTCSANPGTSAAPCHPIRGSRPAWVRNCTSAG